MSKENGLFVSLTAEQESDLDAFEELRKEFTSFKLIKVTLVAENRYVRQCIICGEIGIGYWMPYNHIACIDCLMDELAEIELLSPKVDN